MHYHIFALSVTSYAVCAYATTYCEKPNEPLEKGNWRAHYKNLDSTVVESAPVSLPEGQVYVYENDFPGYTIKYIHVDNVAVKTCGAKATIKSGGTGKSTVFIVMHANSNQEIRSVVDIWGVKNPGTTTGQPGIRNSGRQEQKYKNFKKLKSLYLATGNQLSKYLGS